MPRLARIDAPGVLHHVMIRGIERRKIFRNDKDRDDLLERLSVLLPETGTSCYAWALMSNHAHFLFRSGEAGISSLMGRLLTGYVISFNRRHGRHGQLFQNRYKSVVCQEDSYLTELVRYIHLNPLRAKIVDSIQELEKYPYCGHSVLMDRQKREWQDDRYVLRFFNRIYKKARKNYSEYVKAGVALGRRQDLVGGGLIRSLGGWTEIRKSRLSKKDRLKSDDRILGDSDFVSRILEQAEEKFERGYELRISGYDIAKVIERVLELYDIEKDDLYSGSRRRPIPDAKALLCYWAVRELGYNGVDMSKELGLTPQAVSFAVTRGEKLARSNYFRLIP